MIHAVLLIATGGAALWYALRSGSVTKGQQLADRIRSVLGAPYVWGAKRPTRGFDCSGVVTWALDDLGLAPKGYSTTRNTDRLFVEAQPVSAPAIGDLAFYGPHGNPNHVMVVAGKGKVIGASGGGPATTTVEIARAQGAAVKELPVGYRKDFIRYGRLPAVAS